MKKEIIDNAEEILESKITKKLHENNFVKKLYDTNGIIGEISKEHLSNNKYRFGKKVSVKWLREEELPERTIKLHHVMWSTPLNIKLLPQRTIKNDAMHYVTGKVDDVAFYWEYNPDGELSLHFEEFTLENMVELK